MKNVILFLIIIITVILGTQANIHFGYILAVVLTFSFFYFIYTNYSLKALSNPEIKEINEAEYINLFNSLPQELKSIENLGFKIFTKFKYDYSSIKTTVFFFKSDVKDILFGVYNYGNNKLFPFFSSSFNGLSELTTSNSRILANLPRDESDYFQLLEGKTIQETLKTHTQGVTIIKNKFGAETIEFIEPSDFIEYFKNKQIEKYRSLAPFIFFKIVKCHFINDIKEISNPINEQLNNIENSKGSA